MEWLTDELLFHGGIIIAVSAGIIALVVTFVMIILGMRLGARLDAEYGSKKDSAVTKEVADECQT